MTTFWSLVNALDWNDGEEWKMSDSGIFSIGQSIQSILYIPPEAKIFIAK